MIIIFGAYGQLGKAFQSALNQKNISFKAFGREIDITNIVILEQIFNEYKPEVIINCAAFNLVDEAEVNFHQAFKINAQGVSNLALCAKKFGAFLIHYSTDYVYDGQKQMFYNEQDSPNPLSIYGKSKLSGEYAIKEILENYLIFRTSWVYGNGKQNFIAKLIDWSKQSEYLKIAYDEFSVPTAAKTIAKISLLTLEKGLNGVYCLVNSGFCSRFEWANLINKKLKLNKFIYPVSKESFNLKAKRPFFSAMDNQLISSLLNIEIPYWQTALEEFFNNEYPKD